MPHKFEFIIYQSKKSSFSNDVISSVKNLAAEEDTDSGCTSAQTLTSAAQKSNTVEVYAVKIQKEASSVDVGTDLKESKMNVSI